MLSDWFVCKQMVETINKLIKTYFPVRHWIIIGKLIILTILHNYAQNFNLILLQSASFIGVANSIYRLLQIEEEEGGADPNWRFSIEPVLSVR